MSEVKNSKICWWDEAGDQFTKGFKGRINMLHHGKEKYKPGLICVNSGHRVLVSFSFLVNGPQICLSYRKRKGRNILVKSI